MSEREGAKRAARIELVQARISKEHERRNDRDAEQDGQDDDLRRVATDRRGSAAPLRHGHGHPVHRPPGYLPKRSWYSARDFGRSALIFAGAMKFSLSAILCGTILLRSGDAATWG